MDKLRVGLLVLGLAASVARAEDAPYQRLLKGEDARKAAELEKRVEELQAAGKFAEALPPAREALAVPRQREQGGKHWQTANARREVETLRFLADQPPDARQEMVRSYQQEAEAERLQEKGSHARAEPLLRQVWAVRRRVLGEDHPDSAFALHALALNLNSQEKYAEAEPHLRQVLATWRRTLGDEHPDTAACLNNLGYNLDGQVKYSAAAEFYQQALTIRRKVLGEENPRTAGTLGNLAMNLDAQGKHPAAEPLHRQALAIRRQVSKEPTIGTAYALNNLASNLDHQGQFAEAEGLYRQALAIFRQQRGEDHPDTLTSLNNLATALNVQGKPTEAEPLLRRVLEARNQALTPEHPETAHALANLAMNLDAQGRHAEAEPLHRRALVVQAQALGMDHPAALRTLSNLAANLHTPGKVAEAEPLLRQALDLRRAVLTEKHPDTLSSLNNLGINLNVQGKYIQAEPLLRKTLEVRRQVLARGHADIALSMDNLAMNLNGQTKYTEAETLHRQALDRRRQALGERHPHVALSLNNLGYNLQSQGKLAEAEPWLRQAWDIDRIVLGDSHPGTLVPVFNLAMNLTARGKYRHAEPMWRAAVANFEMARLRVSATGLERAQYATAKSPATGLAACLLRLERFSEAWSAAEAGLARGLLDDLAIQTALPPSEVKRQHLTRAARLEQLDRQLLPLLSATEQTPPERKRLAELVRERAVLQEELAREAATLSAREVVPLDQIQKRLSSETALVFWIDRGPLPRAADPAGDRWGCVVRCSGPPAWVRLPGTGSEKAWTEADDRLPRRLRDALTHGESNWRDLARRLADQRLTPLEPAFQATSTLPAVRRLVVVPAGRMAGVPLEVLTQRYVASYAPSATVYARLCERHRPLREPTLLALGDPVLTAPTAPAPPPPPDHGLLLTLVLSDGNAYKSGLRSGDVLLRYGDQKLSQRNDLKLAEKGDPVAVQVWRAGELLKHPRVLPGRLGVLFSNDPAPVALRKRRELDGLRVARLHDKAVPLPGTRYEIQALQTLFPRATVYLGSAASEQKLDELVAANELKNYQVLHLATHGQIDPAIAARSALLLSRDRLPDPYKQARQGQKVYDGRLTVQTIGQTWQLDADLVTLSACETALGPDAGGEGLLGFAQVLLLKGARALVLSLWKVDDTATALLMTRFYENLLGKRQDRKPPFSKVEALREAQVWLSNLSSAERDRLAVRLSRGLPRGTIVPDKPVVQSQEKPADTPYAHPHYWSAFILLGDPE